MVLLNEETRLKQLEILSYLHDVNYTVDDEYKAHKLLSETMKKLKEENNLENFDITTYVKDGTKRKWKQSRSKANEFTKIFYNEVFNAIELYDITKTEIQFLYSLAPYLLWEENLLVDMDGNALTNKTLADELGLTTKTVFNRTKSLEEKHCLIRICSGRNVYYVVNPFLMFKGQEIHKTLPKQFELLGYESLGNKSK